MTECPDSATLQALIGGRLSEEDAATVSEHVAGCEACRRRADALTDDAAIRRLHQSYVQTPEMLQTAELNALASQPFDPHESPTATFAATSASDSHPTAVDRYRLGEVLGSGAYGIVYRAEDLQLGRPVALKLPRRLAFPDPESRWRFLREARAAAGLHHPQIVALYDAGEWEGICYLASALTPGPTLGVWLVEQSMGIAPRQAAQVVLALAEAVHHAHENGVLHRDIKPQNVLLDPTTHFRELPFSPKLTDFGVAKLLDDKADETLAGRLVGTPRYMAPELAAGWRDQLGAAADIYALGVILYELLTGRVPIEGESHADTLRRVVTEEPLPPRKLRPGVPRDLEAICLTCLEKNPQQRYASAEALAEDLQLFLLEQPTRARPLNPLERAFRWIRRRPAVAGPLAVAVVATIALLVGLALHNRQIRDSNRSLQAALSDAKSAHARAQASDARTQYLLYIADMRLAGRAWREGDYRSLSELLRRHVPRAGEPDRRGLEWRFLANRLAVEPLPLDILSDDIYFVGLAPGGNQLASVGKDATLRWYDLSSRKLEGAIPTGQREVNGLDYFPDARRIVTAGDDGTLRVWNLSDHAELLRIPAHADLAFQVLHTGESNLLVSCGNEPTVRLWDAESGESRGTLDGSQGLLEAIALSADRSRVAAVGKDGFVGVWKLATRTLILSKQYESFQNGCICVAFSPDDRFLVTGNRRSGVRVLSAESGQELAQGPHFDQVHAVTVSPDGRWLASGDNAGGIQLWDLAAALDTPSPSDAEREMVPYRQWLGHRGRVSSLRFESSERLISSAADGQLLVWNVRSAATPVVVSTWISGLALPFFTSAGTLLVRAEPGRLLTWKPDRGTLQEVPEFPADVRFPWTNATGSRIVVFSSPDKATVWEAKQLQEPGPPLGVPLGSWNFEHLDAVAWASLDPKGELLAIAMKAPRNHVLLCDARTGAREASLPLPDGSMRVLLSPIGQQLAVAVDDDVWLWSLEKDERDGRIEGKHSHTLGVPDHVERLGALAYSPDGTILATGGGDRVIRFWDTRTGRLSGELVGQRGSVDGLLFAPDGQTLISAGADGTLKLWSVSAREEFFDLHTDDYRSASDLALSPDGRWLANLRDHQFRLLILDLGPATTYQGSPESRSGF